MAPIERNIGRGDKPDQFEQVVSGLFNAQESKELSAALNGIPGPLSEEIAEWRSKGLGRLIVAPIAPPSYDRGVGEQYRGLAYALPYTDESVQNHDKRVLLIFAADEEEELHRVTLVGPQIADQNQKKKLQAIENDNFLFDFNLLFSPSDKPSIIPGWVPALDEIVHDSFINNQSPFPLINYMPEGTDTDLALTHALTIANKMKVNRIRTDEYSLKNILHPDVLAEVEVLGKDWEQLRREEEVNRQEGQSNPEAA